MNHRTIDSNGIKMHIAEDGEGPLVVLCHGFPELWYSWRHQLKALAKAGYHVAAPDQRGYGQTDRPEAVEDYNLLQLTGDIIGLVDALGETERSSWGTTAGRRSPIFVHCCDQTFSVPSFSRACLIFSDRGRTFARLRR